MFCVVISTPLAIDKVVGPFKTEDDATVWAKMHTNLQIWRVLQLVSP